MLVVPVQALNYFVVCYYHLVAPNLHFCIVLGAFEFIQVVEVRQSPLVIQLAVVGSAPLRIFILNLQELCQRLYIVVVYELQNGTLGFRVLVGCQLNFAAGCFQILSSSHIDLLIGVVLKLLWPVVSGADLGQAPSLAREHALGLPLINLDILELVRQHVQVKEVAASRGALGLLRTACFAGPIDRALVVAWTTPLELLVL